MANIQLDATQIAVITAVWGAFCGTIGWLANFGATAYRTRRDRQHALEDARRARKTAFLAFLRVWDCEVLDNRKIVNASNVLQGVADRFDGNRRELIREATAIESDFNEASPRFDIFVKAITCMTPGGVGTEEGRQKLLKAIQDLITFVTEN